MTLIPTLQQIVTGNADDPTRDMANWNAIRVVVNGNLDTNNLKAAAGIKAAQTVFGTFTDWTAWTPTTTGTTIPGAGTYTTQAGQYMQVGKRVDFWLRLVLSAHTGTGDMKVNLPVAITSTTGARFTFAIFTSGTDLDNATMSIVGLGTAGNSFFNVYQIKDGASSNPAVPGAWLSFAVSGSYQVD